MTTIGQFIEARREAKQWSKRRLAIEAGISHTEVHRIENGDRPNPSVGILTKLADVLGVPKEEMLRVAGYIDDNDESVSMIEKVFPDLKTEKQQEVLQRIVDGLARNSDLGDNVLDDLADQMEMFLAYAKKKRNPD